MTMMTMTMENLSSDYNTKTVARALQSANDYVNRNMASQAKRDVDRAQQYLSKVPAMDLDILQGQLDRLKAEMSAAEEQAETKRRLVLVERNLRYAKEEVQKNNSGRYEGYLATARREIAKIANETIRVQQTELADAVEQQAVEAEAQFQARQRTKELERGLESVRTLVYRAGGTVDHESLQARLDHLRETVAKLPLDLQEEWKKTLQDFAQMYTTKTSVEAEKKEEFAAPEPESSSKTSAAEISSSPEDETSPVDRPADNSKQVERKFSDDDEIAPKIANPSFVQTKCEDLPDLSVDKQCIPIVMDMDVMIRDAHAMTECTEFIRGEFEALPKQVTPSGSKTDIIQALSKVIDAHDTWTHGPKMVASRALQVFQHKYGSDEDYSETFRELFSNAEESLYDAIADDNRLRRTVGSELTNTYKYSSSINVTNQLQDMLDEGDNARKSCVESFLRSAEVDLMVVDYKKGKELVEILQGTRMLLTKLLDLTDTDTAQLTERIRDKMKTVSEKESSRKADIVNARESYRFPTRYANSPPNAIALEAKLRSMLESNGYTVDAIVTASKWIEVRTVLGVFLYSCIDFYVAGRAASAEYETDDQLDVYYVTGKTKDEGLLSFFDSYSIGTVGDMNKSNL